MVQHGLLLSNKLLPGVANKFLPGVANKFLPSIAFFSPALANVFLPGVVNNWVASRCSDHFFARCSTTKNFARRNEQNFVRCSGLINCFINSGGGARSSTCSVRAGHIYIYVLSFLLLRSPGCCLLRVKPIDSVVVVVTFSRYFFPYTITKLRKARDPNTHRLPQSKRVTRRHDPFNFFVFPEKTNSWACISAASNPPRWTSCLAL